MGDLDLPFEPTSGELLDEHVHYSGGVVLMASVIKLDPPLPALVFRFARPNGSGFYPAFVLAVTPKQLRDFVHLASHAVETACEAAS